MRILLTTHAFLPRSVAGVEVYTARLATALQSLGHTVLVVTAVHDLAADPNSARRLNVGTIDVVEIVNTHAQGTLEATCSNPAIDRVLDELIDEFRPDCVHVQHVLNLSSGIFVSTAARRLPIFLTLHDYWLSCPRDGLRMQADGTLCATVDHRICASCLADSPYLPPPLQRGAAHALRLAGLGRVPHLIRRFFPRASLGLLSVLRSSAATRVSQLETDLDRRDELLRERVALVTSILAPTRFAMDRAIEWGVPPARVRLLLLGAVMGPAVGRAAVPRRRFAYVGSISPHKGLHVLLEAIIGLENRDWTLDIVGNMDLNPGYAAHLRALARNDTRVRFVGPVPPTEHTRLWSTVDVLVLPSLWWENSPLTVLEALAAGIPVIASRTGGVPEIVPPGAGALVAPGDVGALRVALGDVLDDRLLSGSLDPLPLKTVHEGALELSALYAEAAQAR